MVSGHVQNLRNSEVENQNFRRTLDSFELEKYRRSLRQTNCAHKAEVRI